MNDRELDATLRAIHLDRMRYPDSEAVVQYVIGTPIDEAPQQRGWLPQSPKWRFQSMFSATKFVVAGVIVALFGGFLLAGVLTQRGDEPLPAVGASASASPEVRSDLLPGVDLATEEVSPGLFRVLGDGERRTLGYITDVAVAPNGDIWVMRSNGTVYRLGATGNVFQQRRASFGQRNDGMLWVGDRRLEGDEWLTDETAFCAPDSQAQRAQFYSDATSKRLAPDGTCWVSEASQAGAQLVQRDPSGEELEVHRPVPNVGPLLFDIAPDGTVWSTFWADPGGLELVSYDGSTWTPREIDGFWEPAADLRVAPDGTVWVVARGPEGLAALSWDGEAWTTYEWDEDDRWGCCGPYPGTEFLPDGSPWFGGLVEIDGGSLRPIDIRATIGVKSPVVKALANRPDGSTWVVVDPGVDDGRPRTPPPHLYVITPEAVAATE